MNNDHMPLDKAEARLAELKQDYIVFSNLRDTRNTRQDL